MTIEQKPDSIPFLWDALFLKRDKRDLKRIQWVTQTKAGCREREREREQKRRKERCEKYSICIMLCGLSNYSKTQSKKSLLKWITLGKKDGYKKIIMVGRGGWGENKTLCKKNLRLLNACTERLGYQKTGQEKNTRVLIRMSFLPREMGGNEMRCSWNKMASTGDKWKTS